MARWFARLISGPLATCMFITLFFTCLHVIHLIHRRRRGVLGTLDFWGVYRLTIDPLGTKYHGFHHYRNCLPSCGFLFAGGVLAIFVCRRRAKLAAC